MDAAAKVGRLLQDEGAAGGRQLLSRFRVQEAMRRTGRRAYETTASSERYLHSVWTVRTDVEAAPWTCPTSGHGGNHVLMPPSGLVIIRFMDAGDYEVSHATRAAETYRSSCS